MADAGDRPLKWVFTLNGRAKSPTYTQMAKVAVLSAKSHTTLIPVCIYTGGPDETSACFEEEGVRVIHHQPQWAAKLQIDVSSIQYIFDSLIPDRVTHTSL